MKTTITILAVLVALTMSSQTLPRTHIGFGSTSNALSGSSLLRYSPSATNDSTVLNVNEFHTWTGYDALNGFAPYFNVSRTVNGYHYASVENKSGGADAITAFFLNGYPDSFEGGLSNVYGGMQLFSPNYTAVPQYAGKFVIGGGGGTYGSMFFQDRGNIEICTRRVNGYYAPCFVMQGTPTNGLGSGYIGMGTYTPTTRLHIHDGELTIDTLAILSRNNIPFVDQNGVFKPNPKIFINYNVEGLNSILTCTTATGQAIMQVATNDNTNSSTMVIGKYSSGIYAYLSVVGASNTADPYPFTPRSTVLLGDGGSLNLGTYQDHDVSIYRNQVEKVRLTSTSANYSVNITSTKGLALSYVSKTSNYTATENDYTIDCTGEITISLPSCSALPVGKIYVLKNSGINIVTIDPYSTQTVDDAPTRIVSAPFGRTTIQNTGADWIVIN